MANVTVYNMEGNEVGTMELNDAVFGVEINEHLVQQELRSGQAAVLYSLRFREIMK